MANERGTIHILRNFHQVDKTGVYDVAYTADDATEPNPEQPIRRLFGEQELVQFLKRYLHRDQTQVDRLLGELQQNGRARISGIEWDREQLRKLDLAA